jgi:hypothetical protein
MLARVLILLRARLAAQHEGAALPIAALLMQALITSAICGLVRGETTPFAYALVALSISGALIAVPLLGELAYLLVADESGDWVSALPVRPVEIHLARTAQLVIALLVLSLGSLVPAALIAPQSIAWPARVELVALGLGQAVSLAAVLLLVQATLRGRAQALLVLVQTLVFAGVIVGFAVGLRLVPQLVAWQGPAAASALKSFPPAWFAAPLAQVELSSAWSLGAVACTALALLVLLVLPAPPATSTRRGAPLLSRFLALPRRLAARVWVRGRERATFELLFDALPKERDFVIRTYPLLAVPVAFLLANAGGEQGHARDGLLALLLFVPGAYVPLMSAHVPGSTSHRARWLLDCAPVDRNTIDNGAIKAIAIRFLLPLYLVLALIAWSCGGGEVALLLALPAWITAVLVLRRTWRTCVKEQPLSTAPDDLFVNLDWIGTLGGLGLGLTIVAIAASRVVTTWPRSVVFTLVLIAIEVASDRAWRAAKPQPS